MFNSLLLTLLMGLNVVNKLYFCKLLEEYVLIEQNISDTKNGFESDFIVSRKDEMVGSLTRLTANDELSVIFNEDGVNI